MKALISAILDQYELPLTSIHGPAHWARVFEIGNRLAATTGARLDVVGLFAVFHDACRVSDGDDHGHGQRGARLAESLWGDYFELDEAGLDLLVMACCNHTSGYKDGDVTVQTCWDADRLDLGRAGIVPLPWKLCTPSARQPEVIQWATSRSIRRVVPDLVKAEWGILTELS